jgi:hypothetical protein
VPGFVWIDETWYLISYGYANRLGPRVRSGTPLVEKIMKAVLVTCSVLALLIGTAFSAEPKGGASSDRMEMARAVSRSMWAIVPAMTRKDEVKASQITGSAVAVSADRLLAACGALDDRQEVALWRHDTHLTGRLVTADATGHICTLQVLEKTLRPVRGLRDPTSLEPGEPVYAVFNETSAEGALAEGRLEASESGQLAVSLNLPNEVRSAVIFDGAGNLLGMGATDPRAPGATVAALVDRALAPELAPLGVAALTQGPTSATAGEEPLKPVVAPSTNDERSDNEVPMLLRLSGELEETGRKGRNGRRAGFGGSARGPAGSAQGVQNEPAAGELGRLAGSPVRSGLSHMS